MLSLENLWVILITTVAGLVVGITGFGYGLVATPLYATLMPMYQAVALVTISSLPLMVQNALSVRSSIPWREIWPVLTLSLPASALGTWALARSDTRYLEFILAAMTIMGALVSLWSPKKALLKRAWPGAYIAGVVGGFVGGAVATGGPPVVLYCLLRGWDWQGFEPEEPAAKTAGVWRRLVSFRSALGRAPRARVQ